MKLALYLPNFRDEVTVRELEDLTALAEDLDFDSVWTLDRIVVPEAFRPRGAAVPVRHDDRVPPGMPVISRGKWFQGMTLIPWLAAKTRRLAIGMSIIDTPYRSPGVLAAELATQDHLSGGRLNVGVGSGWMPEEFAAASVPHLFPRRHAHVRETIEIMQGIWTNDLFEYHGEFADFPLSGFGHKPIQQPGPADLLLRPQGREALGQAHREVRPVGLDRHPGLAEDIRRWKGEMERELNELGRGLPEGFDMCSMIWFVITDEPMDQTPAGKATNLLAGSAQQIEDILKRYKEAGMTMPLLWPPFRDVPTAKTIDDLKRLTEEIMPKVNAS
jgi:alkanesulfonate monooxygenase SsuD/methylene tetrahydromethanopterin reductase-like flavin-dependent oxidoreductase (luciferase family)